MSSVYQPSEKWELGSLGLNNQTWIEDTWTKIVAKIGQTSERIGSTFPHVSKNGRYDATSPNWWTAGFWPGMLWTIYADTKEERLRQIAEACEVELDSVLQRFYELDHDMGFMWTLTARANYRLTGNLESRRRALAAASHLAGRFNLAGGYIRAWNSGAGQSVDKTGWAIIDCMMNLPLLYWASEEILDPRFRHVARAHADTVLREFIRPDGSVYHIVCFDPETGERVAALGGQGHAEQSAWSRGTAWALYGCALTYAYTREERFLDAAKRVAHFFVANLPADWVPYWDFRVDAKTDTTRDASAAAIAACGLLEIAKWVPEVERSAYQQSACRILQSLTSHYASWELEEEGLILQSTGNAPQNQNVNVPIIYGDYYFVEAIARLSNRMMLNETK